MAMARFLKLSTFRIFLSTCCVVLAGLCASSVNAATVYDLGTIEDGFSTTLDGPTNGDDRLSFTLVATASAPKYEVTFEGTIGSARSPLLLGADESTVLATLNNGNPFTLTLTPEAGPAGTDFLFFFGRFSGDDTVALSVAAVPLPAAAWLFISALGALAGVKRMKRRQQHELAAA